MTNSANGAHFINEEKDMSTSSTSVIIHVFGGRELHSKLYFCVYLDGLCSYITYSMYITDVYSCNVTVCSRWGRISVKHRPIRVSRLVNLSHPGRFKFTEWFEKTQGRAGRSYSDPPPRNHRNWGRQKTSKAPESTRLASSQWTGSCLDVFTSRLKKKHET